ncbi:RNA polymerase sigma factor [Pontibacter sp. G13]|uniref:RNA polymerase sigma factor n=1 Tax=Pontibacter sp. G13 TaxID=3074898 RepID=UPI002889E268|nr:RNA polymerase sigma factor [Pontibacter sp. G13]WNJ17621.1 RNA polymerase sigma factor [Pontibacter sp. G13]
MDKTLFEHIYTQHVGEIRRHLYYRSGREEIANDLTQETFLKVWEGSYEYDPQKIRALLFKIAGGLFLDFVRREKLQIDHLEAFSFKLKESVAPDPDATFYLQQCEQALLVLTEKERTVFLLNRMDGLTYPDIAESLGLSVKAIEKRMSKALKKLKTHLNATTP